MIAFNFKIDTVGRFINDLNGFVSIDASVSLGHIEVEIDRLKDLIGEDDTVTMIGQCSGHLWDVKIRDRIGITDRFALFVKLIDEAIDLI